MVLVCNGTSVPILPPQILLQANYSIHACFIILMAQISIKAKETTIVSLYLWFHLALTLTTIGY